MTFGFVIYLTIVLGASGIPQLDESALVRLETSVDRVDSLDEGCRALIEHVAGWSPPFDEIKETPPSSIVVSPAIYRGKLLKIAGVVEQQVGLPFPWEGVDEWFVRDDQGMLYILYVVGEIECSLGTQISAPARFYKTMSIEGRDLRLRVYPTFVTHAIAIEQTEAVTVTQWIYIYLPILVLGFAIVIALGMFGKSKKYRSPSVRIRSEEVHRAMNETCGTLPEDPAKALADLNAQSEDSP